MNQSVQLSTEDYSIPEAIYVDRKCYLLGVEVHDCYMGIDFIPRPGRDDFHLCHVSAKYAPAKVFFHTGKTVYGLYVKDVVRSKEFMCHLCSQDCAELEALAKLNPPKPDYSKWIYRSEL